MTRGTDLRDMKNIGMWDREHRSDRYGDKDQGGGGGGMRRGDDDGRGDFDKYNCER